MIGAEGEMVVTTRKGNTGDRGGGATTKHTHTHTITHTHKRASAKLQDSREDGRRFLVVQRGPWTWMG